MAIGDGLAGSESTSQAESNVPREYTSADVRRALELEKAISYKLETKVGQSLSSSDPALLAYEVSRRRVTALSHLYEDMLRGS